MHNHTLEVLGLELSFRAEADPARIERARALLNERYARLARHGGALSKEKLLAFLALSLADDVLLLQEEQGRAEKRIEDILANLEKAAGQ